VIYSSGAGVEPFFLIVLTYPPLLFLDPNTVGSENRQWGLVIRKPPLEEKMFYFQDVLR
jgi:hypothetical protein